MKKLILETEWQTYSSEFKNMDTSLEQVFESLRGMLVSYGWSQKTIDEYIIEWSEELKGLYNE